MNAPLPTVQPADMSTSAMVLDFNLIEKMNQLATVMASSKITIPKHLQNNAGDCFAVVMQSMQWKMNPFAVAQKTHVVNGTLGYEAQLVNAVIQSSGAITGHFHYDYRGDSNALECRVGAVIRGEKEVTWGEWLKISDVTTKNSPLWKTNPRQQLGYLQVKNWSRAFCPGAILGVYSTDELETIDMGAAERVDEPAPPAKPAASLAGYSAENFAANLPKWTEIIASGKKTADDIIAMVQTKGALSDQQKATLRAIVAKPQPKPEPAISAPAERIDRIRAAAADAAISDSDIMMRFSLPSMDAIPERMVDHIMAFISDPTA